MLVVGDGVFKSGVGRLGGGVQGESLCGVNLIWAGFGALSFLCYQ